MLYATATPDRTGEGMVSRSYSLRACIVVSDIF